MRNRTALVTGSSRGIGLIITKRLQNDQIKVLKPDRNELDLSSAESIRKYISYLKEPVDIIINNAGIQKIGTVEKFSITDFQEILQINLLGPFQLIVGLLDQMKKRKYGRIVNMSTIWSFYSREGRAIYASSKAGLNSITRSLALELAPYNVLINAIAPGFINTEMTMQNNTKKQLKEITTKIPMKRLGEASEIAEYVAFLCSEKNSYMTGQTLVIDGGFTIGSLTTK